MSFFNYIAYPSSLFLFLPCLEVFQEYKIILLDTVSNYLIMGKKQMKVVKLDYHADTRAGFVVREMKEKPPIPIEAPNLDYNIPLDPTEIPRCEFCKSVEIDPIYYNTFKVKICKICIKDHESEFALLTKTEAKQDYMLTEPELKSLNHMEKVNPHRSQWYPMQLFLRKDLENFAIRKWGSLEKMDQEFYRREAAKKSKKEEKYNKKLKKLRSGVRTGDWERKSTEDTHLHDFGASSAKNVLVCQCGETLEEETF
eukprot:NODE_10_length_61504_cov_0.956502.p26 type:complete len:255 gc:universal NODE_10_length_61504_cov_0.956502:34696-35460(+)